MTYLKIRPYIRRGIYFMLIGPLVGLALILLTLVIIYLPSVSPSDFSDVTIFLGYFLVIPFYGLIVAYPVGFVPAAITGVVSRLGKNNFQEMAYAITAGGGSCLTFGLVASDAPFALASGLLGCVSGSICVMIRRRRDAKLVSHHV